MRKASLPEHVFIAISHYTLNHVERKRERQPPFSTQYVHRKKNRASLRPLYGRPHFVLLRPFYSAVDIICTRYDYYQTQLINVCPRGRDAIVRILCIRNAAGGTRFSQSAIPFSVPALPCWAFVPMHTVAVDHTRWKQANRSHPSVAEVAAGRSLKRIHTRESTLTGYPDRLDVRVMYEIRFELSASEFRIVYRMDSSRPNRPKFTTILCIRFEAREIGRFCIM